jgi:hypothetical protein
VEGYSVFVAIIGGGPLNKQICMHQDGRIIPS